MQNDVLDFVDVTKKTGSYADVLVAIGMADLLQEVKRVSTPTAAATIRDEGDHYRITIRPALTSKDFEKWHPGPGYCYIKLKEDDPDCPPTGYYDYEAARGQEKVYKEYQETLGKQATKVAKSLQEQGLEHPVPPPDDLPVIKTFNAMRMGSNSYNQLHKALRETAGLSRLVMSRIGLANFDPALQQDEPPLKKAASVLQLFNPAAGKGTHRPKPDSSAAAGFSDKLADWFEEWLKFRAMHLAMLTYPVGDDTKVFIIAPENATVNQIALLRQSLLAQRLFGSLWLDIQAILSSAKFLIEHSQEYAGSQGVFTMRGHTPQDIIKGFNTTYFKSLGTASATMNISFLGLPGWLPVNSAQDAEDWLEIIAEHRGNLKSLNEKNSSDVPILQLYRDFISTGRLELALEFFVLYGVHFMRRKAQKQWAEAFTTKNLRRLFMGYGLQEIIQNPGFQNVARAIRRATINAQMQKAITGKTPFEIHYGLAQDWKRKVKFKDQFIIELADFIQRYNNENARHMEQGKGGRALVTTKDLNEVVDLIEKHSSELVGMLLLAYGYARDPQETDE